MGEGESERVSLSQSGDMREAGRQTETERQTEQSQERQERSMRQERELCLAGTFKGCACHMADSGKSPGNRG